LTSDTALAELRLTTRAEADRIEHVLRLTEPMTMARYAAIMSGFDAFMRLWEPRVQAALPPRLQHWFRSRRRGGFASADVEWLRDIAGEPPVAMSAAAVEKLPLDDLPQLLGSLYVIEGAALGGRLNAPHLKSTLGVGAGCGATYFHGFGGQTGLMWRDFRVLASLEIGESSKATVRACRSAKRTFGALIDLFAPLAPLASLPDLQDAAALSAPRSPQLPAWMSIGDIDPATEDDTIVDLR
jgi:heme oxygenase